MNAAVPPPTRANARKRHRGKAAAATAPVAIVPREQLDFGLDGEIPRHWFGGDAFKTRLFDAMSTMFPEGERFFINCVRDYRALITDPQLQEDVRRFIRQEAQHTRVHRQYNALLKQQGIDIDALEGDNGFRLDRFRRVLPKSFTLAMTAAAEHLTAIMAHGFFERDEAFAEADPRLHAVYLWHGVEEIEHKGVAFDVMHDVAHVGYVQRVAAMALLTVFFPHRIWLAMDQMLEVDGYSRAQRVALAFKALGWMLAPRTGLLTPMLGHYFAYYRPGFHPWRHGSMQRYREWLARFEAGGDPVAAADSGHERKQAA